MDVPGIYTYVTPHMKFDDLSMMLAYFLLTKTKQKYVALQQGAENEINVLSVIFRIFLTRSAWICESQLTQINM